MNIVVTGSLGNISKPLTIELIRKGHSVTVISSNLERQKAIEDLGAAAAIGTMKDIQFLTTTFTGADVVYVMEALEPGAFFDPDVDVIAAVTQIGHVYKQAIQNAGIRRVVHLSSIGAHTSQGTGLIAMHYNVETILNQLPDDVAIKFMRPVGFYTTLFGFIQTIKNQGVIVSNYGGEEKEPWVSPADIASVIAEEIEKPFAGREVQYIASDEVSPNEVARMLGQAIGRPDLQWVVVPDDQFLEGLIAAGMNQQTARKFVEMNASRFGGVMYQDYNCHRPTLGNSKLTDFATDFAAVYHQQ